jgi:hypothetical protein
VLRRYMVRAMFRFKHPSTRLKGESAVISFSRRTPSCTISWVTRTVSHENKSPCPSSCAHHARRNGKTPFFPQSSSIDSHPSAPVPPFPSGSGSSSDSLLSSSTPTSLSLTSPSVGATRSANARRTAGFVLVSYKSEKVLALSQSLQYVLCQSLPSTL